MSAEIKPLIPWIAAVLAVGFLFLYRFLAAFVSGSEAKELLQAGAKVVDVRSTQEFTSCAVAGAINIPLGELTQRIATVVPDKNTPILVHCLSGGRSAIARRKLRRLGYTQIHNLGSLARAKSIVEG